MTIFTVNITQGQYEERTETTLIFSSLKKVQEWKDSYKTSADSFYYYGEERAQIKEIEIDTNKLISVSDPFCIDIEEKNRVQIGI